MNLEKIWIHLRSSLWFLPALFILGAIALALGLIEVDVAFESTLEKRWPKLFSVSPEGARGMLSAIASSSITVAGVIFSIVIVALSIASNQYTPRILRTFMRDRSTQSVLGIFVAVFTYSLVVLRTIRSGDLAFVPSISIGAALVLSLISIGFLVYFIHHIAASIQAPTMIAGICNETITTIETLFPKEAPEGNGESDDEAVNETEWQTLAATETGYLQHVASDLVEFADKHDLVLRLERRMGEFITKGTPLIAVAGKKTLPPRVEKRILRSVAIDTFRTVEQDPGYGVRQLVDIAIKALSPGVNDTTTAINAIDYLGAILQCAVQREPFQPRIFCNGKLRLIHAHCQDVEHLIDEAMIQVRQSATNNPAVMLRLLKVLATTGSETKERYREALLKHLALIEEVAGRSITLVHDRDVVLERARRVRDEIGQANGLNSRAGA